MLLNLTTIMFKQNGGNEFWKIIFKNLVQFTFKTGIRILIYVKEYIKKNQYKAKNSPFKY